MAADQTKEAKYRQHKGVMATVVATVAITFSVYHVLYILPYLHGFAARAGIVFDQPMHMAIHLGLILFLVFWLVPIREKASIRQVDYLGGDVLCYSSAS